jgi:RimJ/RimL family protein N-acetyltransferase
VADTDSLAAVYADPDVVRFLRPLDRKATGQQVVRFTEEWQQRACGVFAVVDAGTGRFLGRSGLHYWPQFDETEVGWVLRRDVWGNGFATEAGAASIQWGFEQHAFALITAIIASDNIASIAVARRLGMTVLREDNIFGQSATVFATRQSEAAGV